MRRMPVVALAVILILAAVACRAPKVRIPPRIDLTQHQTIGVVQFATTAEGDLAPFATNRFIEAMRRDQGMVRVVGLGTEAEALGSIQYDKLDREAFRALGQKQELRTIITGKLTVSDVKPAVRISPDLRSGSLSAEVEATLEVEMIEAESGASIWSASSSGKRTVRHVSVLDAKNVVFDADDPESAYGDLVNYLVARVTRDFQSTWQ